MAMKTEAMIGVVENRLRPYLVIMSVRVVAVRARGIGDMYSCPWRWPTNVDTMKNNVMC